MSAIERVYTEDTSSGQVHLRVRDGGRLLVDERCNLDQAGAYSVLTPAEVEAVEPERFCGHCVPRAGDVADAQ